jgi:hypothetical protein
MIESGSRPSRLPFSGKEGMECGIPLTRSETAKRTILRALGWLERGTPLAVASNWLCKRAATLMWRSSGSSWPSWARGLPQDDCSSQGRRSANPHHARGPVGPSEQRQRRTGLNTEAEQSSSGGSGGTGHFAEARPLRAPAYRWNVKRLLSAKRDRVHPLYRATKALIL